MSDDERAVPDGPVYRCATYGEAESCVAAGLFTATPDAARAFDACRFQGLLSVLARPGLLSQRPPSSTFSAAKASLAGCADRLPARAEVEAGAICAVTGEAWCHYVEELRQQRAAGATLVVGAIAIAACVLAIRHRLRRRAVAGP